MIAPSWKHNIAQPNSTQFIQYAKNNSLNQHHIVVKVQSLKDISSFECLNIDIQTYTEFVILVDNVSMWQQ